MRKIGYVLFGIAIALTVEAIAALILLKSSHGFSTRAEPKGIERWLARKARDAALPSGVARKQNPVPRTEEALAEARAHWADHCALCHGNDGSGDPVMGRNMYPTAPDMRKPETQKLTDGELFYIIENGIRLTGMPGWGGASEHDAQDS